MAYAAPGYGPSWFRFNPWNSSRVNASIQDYQGGYLLSTDAGATWSAPQYSYIDVGDYVFHSAVSNVILSVGGQYTGASTTTNNILFSNDSGATWTAPGTYAFGQGRFNLALDQRNPSILYVAGRIVGIR